MLESNLPQEGKKVKGAPLQNEIAPKSFQFQDEE